MQTRTARVLRPFSAAVHWLAGHELAVLLSMLLVAAGAWGFVELAGEVVEGDTQAADEWILRVLRDPADTAVPIGPRWLHEMGRDLTALGGYAFMGLLTFSVAGFLLLDKKYGAMWFVLAAIAGGFIGSMALKAAFSRPRPDIVPHLSIVYTTSFPSGHSMMSAVVYLTLGALLTRLVQTAWLKAYFLGNAVLLTLLVGMSRVYLGVHYPTDVLAGWTAGFVWATLCWLVALQLQRRGTVERTLDPNSN